MNLWDLGTIMGNEAKEDEGQSCKMMKILESSQREMRDSVPT